MTNIVSIGCSHSLGYYDMDNNASGEKTWPEALYNSHENVSSHVHIALSGHGIVDYCYILMKLAKYDNLLKHVDKLIIQHTSEPRCVFYDDVHMIDKFLHYRILSYFHTHWPYGGFNFKKGDNNLKVLNLKEFNMESFRRRPINLTSPSLGVSIEEGALAENRNINSSTKLELVNQFDKMSMLFRNSPTVQNAIRLSHEKIHAIAKENNIKLYEFIWPSMNNPLERTVERLKIVEDYDKISNYDGHVLEKSIDAINDSIIGLMKTNGFFD